MIKTYEWKGGLWRFNPDDAPADAVEHVRKPKQESKPEPKPKARRTRNKARSARNKEANND